MKKKFLQSTMMTLLAAMAVNVASAQQPHVYINPGHGGYDSDDRNMVIYPFHQGDSAGSWESKSNLRKGLALQEILQKKGYKTSISRVANTTADDLASRPSSPCATRAVPTSSTPSTATPRAPVR